MTIAGLARCRCSWLVAASILARALTAQGTPALADVVVPVGGLGTQASSLVDVDADGFADLTLIVGSVVKIWHGSPNGLQGPALIITSPVGLHSGTVADLDGDGRGDLVLLPSVQAELLISFSKSDGSFSPFETLPLPTYGRDVIAADVNGDGQVDLLVSQSSVERCSVLRGLGGGDFAPSFDTNAVKSAFDMHLGDTDADGVLDVVALSGATLFTTAGTDGGLGDGTFAPPVAVALSMPAIVSDADCMDANLDGYDDVVVALSKDFVELHAGGSSGDLGPPIQLPSVAGVSSVAVTDANADGLPDLFVASSTKAAGVMIQTGAGLVLDPAWATSTHGGFLQTADVDGDGLADAVMTQFDTSRLLVAQQGGGFRNGYAADLAQRDALVADLDGDGRPDLLSCVQGTPTGRLRLGRPNGAFGNASTLDLGAGARQLFAGDADLDGDVDVLVAVEAPGAGGGWMLNDGRGVLAAQAITSAEATYRAAAADDIDGDGRLDLLVAKTTSGLAPSLDVLLTAGDATLHAQPSLPIDGIAVALAAGDFDGAGWHDVAAVFTGTGAQILRLNPNGTALATSIALPGLGQGIALGNFDGDGRCDVLVSSQKSSGPNVEQLDWWEADDSGAPSFVGNFALPVGAGPLALGDIDGDGRGELFDARDEGELDGAVLRSDGGPPHVDQLFSPTEAFTRLRLADVDGDGLTDLVALGADTSAVTWFPNALHRWQRSGPSLAGTAGKSRLEGVGPMLPGEPVILRAEGAIPNSSAVLVLGLSALDAPFKGGMLVPNADVLLTGPSTDAAGALTLAGHFPAGVPSGTTIVAQLWFRDAQAPEGFSSTGGVIGTSP